MTQIFCTFKTQAEQKKAVVRRFLLSLISVREQRFMPSFYDHFPVACVFRVSPFPSSIVLICPCSFFEHNSNKEARKWEITFPCKEEEETETRPIGCKRNETQIERVL